MKILRLISALILSASFIFVSCNNPGTEQSSSNGTDYTEEAANPNIMHEYVKAVNDVMVHDIFSPPVASRIYSYSSIAAYEVLAQTDDAYRSLAGQITDFEGVPQAPADKEMCMPLSAGIAFVHVGKALVFSEHMVEEYENEMLQQFRDMGVPDDVFDRSVEYGHTVGAAIMEYAKGDNYIESRSFERYTVVNEPGMWLPTPPDYMDAIEPNWMKIRPFVLDSCNQFTPPPPTPFSTDPNSQFYKEVMQVKVAKDTIDDENTEIAKFWDCNPFVTKHQGHLMLGVKKITPGGHWIGITRIACKTDNADLVKTAQAYALTSIALFDGFISCWDEKYRSNLIRPETVINAHLDVEWKPVLTTPPFPEYTSGHSVVSSAAAITLTSIFGDNFAYIDSVEVDYGLPPRSYDSFIEASEEAAISRLYGGIHYMPAIEHGITQGRQVGNWVVSNVQTKNLN